jgi:hypothetical protein
MVVPAMTDDPHPPPPDPGPSDPHPPPPDPGPSHPQPPPPDPVLERRARIALWARLGQRVGYSALAVAVAVFSVALYWDLPRVLLGIIVACLVVASVALLPSIVFGYGVRAAEREDRRLGNPSSPRRGRP